MEHFDLKTVNEIQDELMNAVPATSAPPPLSVVVGGGKKIGLAQV